VVRHRGAVGAPRPPRRHLRLRVQGRPELRRRAVRRHRQRTVRQRRRDLRRDRPRQPERCPDLDSETSLNYELGFKARYDRYFGGLSLYYNDIQDFITFVDFGDETGQIQNIAEARIWGIELDLETIFANWWSLFVNAAYSEGDNKADDEPLGFIPPFKVVAGLRYQHPRWWAEASARIVSDQTRVPEDADESPGFTTFDLRAGYDFDFGLGVLASLENFTDKLYAEPFNNRPEPGRNLRVGLRYRF
jgi:outer membrane receptor protein involved in Fe transport